MAGPTFHSFAATFGCVGDIKATMNIRESIQSQFSGKAFERPLFYSHDKGLRFELSLGGDWLDQFDLALRKSHEICEDIFDKEIVACYRIFSDEPLVSSISTFRELRDIGLFPERDKEHWFERVAVDEDWIEDENEDYWHTVAVKLPKSSLKKLLWCSMAQDLGVKPCPQVNIYLFDLSKGVEVWPYDDRGMDVIGNTAMLSQLYKKFNSYLLDYDREIMDTNFG
ncbi:DUF3885 domain-containing protein [Microbulbifer sp. GL-2]|uniref:DUF3885 domain-containing protein n=1 Tax=Microbulbifer sp. GL-2 TaxID=2591606 RepID=UPI001162D7C8|nr:DUF3885 domain-containing protein [Microbulbifer sp. GL-2]BBM02521.1 hypothetical protein GL2_25950 [Microbulbifer sp. GL-2]